MEAYDSPAMPYLELAADASEYERERVGMLDALLREKPEAAHDVLRGLEDVDAVLRTWEDMPARPPESEKYPQQLIRSLGEAFALGLDFGFRVHAGNGGDQLDQKDAFGNRNRLRVQRLSSYVAALVAEEGGAI